MKILLGVPEYPPHHVGGGGEVFKNLAENYKKLGHEVAVIYGYYPTKSWNEEIKEFTNEGIKFYQIPEIPYPKSSPYLRTVMPPNLKAWFKLKSIITKEKPDVAHLHGYGFIFINKLGKILHKKKIPYIFTIHGYPETQNSKNFFIRLIYKIFEKYSIKKSLKNSIKITAISDYIKNDKRNTNIEKSLTIYNGINFGNYKKDRKKINVRKKHRVDKNTKIILSLGRIAKMKGFHLIINKIPEFLKKQI